MSNLKRFFNATLLTLVLTLPVLAGQIELPSPEPPPPRARASVSNEGQTCDDRAAQNSTTAPPNDSAVADVLSLLRDVLSIF
jgi:hypothetical protein